MKSIIIACAFFVGCTGVQLDMVGADQLHGSDANADSDATDVMVESDVAAAREEVGPDADAPSEEVLSDLGAKEDISIEEAPAREVASEVDTDAKCIPITSCTWTEPKWPGYKWFMCLRNHDGCGGFIDCGECRRGACPRDSAILSCTCNIAKEPFAWSKCPSAKPVYYECTTGTSLAEVGADCVTYAGGFCCPS